MRGYKGAVRHELRALARALRLGLDSCTDPPKRPAHMRLETYARIRAELDPLMAEINRRVAIRMARARGPLGALPALARWGL